MSDGNVALAVNPTGAALEHPAGLAAHALKAVGRVRVGLFGGRYANGGLAKLKMQANIILAGVNPIVKIAADVSFTD